MIDIQTLYSQRFHEAGLERRRRVWRVLCDEFFSRLVEPNDSVLDLACGYGEFINAVRAKQRIGIDLNPDAARFLDSAVRFYQAAATDLSEISISGIDVVFTSNFLEHLSSKEQCSEVFQQVHRVLKPGGRFIILGPNIRYAYREYWNYFDHQIALSDLAVVEGLQQTGFRMQRVIPRFLPFTMQHSLPTNDTLVRLYLKLPLVWRVFGKQFLVVASKSG
jgi:ubiquinone/menaquinone biosynthesis C-methylase UbiE